MGNLQGLIEKLKSYHLPEKKLPLCKDRETFRELDYETIEHSINTALNYPEKEGRLTDIIYEQIGMRRKFSKDCLILEAHLDTTKMDTELQKRAIILGFEPDNFEKIVPANFTDHYTLRFNIPIENRKRFQELKKLMIENFYKLADLIQENPNTNGYIELEIYGSKYITNYRYSSVREEALYKFPFQRSAFLNIKLPRTEYESKASGIDLYVHKSADIHIKTPLDIRGDSFPDAESVEMEKLRQKMIDMGFYEVVTENGNKIYTGQFLGIREAIYVYNVLDKYFRESGGAIQMYMEPCPMFWRKKTQAGNDFILSEVPPLVKLNSDEAQRMLELNIKRDNKQ